MRSDSRDDTRRQRGSVTLPLPPVESGLGDSDRSVAMRGGCCVNGWSVRGGQDDFGMAQNFVACDREQELLLPPSLRERLPEGHLAWFVIDAVAQVDLSAFYVVYRDNGQGRAAHDPAMMVALLLYSYAASARRGASNAAASRTSPRA